MGFFFLPSIVELGQGENFAGRIAQCPKAWQIRQISWWGLVLRHSATLYLTESVDSGTHPSHMRFIFYAVCFIEP